MLTFRESTSLGRSRNGIADIHATLIEFRVNSYYSRRGDNPFVKFKKTACYSPAVDYLKGLNDKQKEAVLHTEGPLLIVAGAGAGKTKTITHRIAHSIEKGVPARAILAVTFTNKAAGEMRERVRALVLPGMGVPMVATFHALGVRILREFHLAAGLARNFVIWDRDDSTKALKTICEQIGMDSPARSILSGISRQKGEGISRADYAEGATNFRERNIARAWELYEKVLAENAALDFDDLLGRTLRLLRESPETLSLLQNRWHYITIDEYQDTNAAQYEIAKLLAGERRNICVVGDIDQNIYSWRGADIEHLLSFERSFPGATSILLEQNYRSTRTILKAANDIIEKNTRRVPKNLYTDNPTGEPIMLYPARSEIDEAWFIAETSAHLIESGIRPGEIAVLYRENFQSRAIEEAMLAAGIQYRVLGTRFFERKEVKDVLSYLRGALNPKSKVDLMRIVASPPRGIGKITLDKMLAGQEAELGSAPRAKVTAFRTLLTKIEHAIKTLPASEAVKYAAEESGMEKSMKDTDEGRERLDNIRELVNLAVRYDEMTPPEGVERLLEEAALQSEQDELKEERNAVSLMTVHASKGLEFDAVFVTGLEQGLFPSIRENDGTRDSEEERRLFYVALTRARKRVFLTSASERMRWGSREYTLPSEFLRDIDQRLVASATQEYDDGEQIIR
jgi:DNA helicase-2/ATP-dependent DNA helicase PcrA